MYLFFGILILFLIFCSIFNFRKKKRICKKICCMCPEEKCQTLNELTEPFGFSYDLCTDLFYSAVDAWQKDLGYCRFYDKAAASMNMVFDCEPIYFSYREQTWLIEFWKGQYGINAGAEVGIYRADSIVPEKDLSSTLFFGVPKQEMLPICIELLDENNCPVFCFSKPHWWLACFRMGVFTSPRCLRLNLSITFPNEEMKCAFLNGLINAGYDAQEIRVCRLRVSLCFSVPKTPAFRLRFRYRFAQWRNRQLVRLYLFFTKPFCITLDRMLYLYYFAPRFFGKALSVRRTSKAHAKGHFAKKF